MADDLAREIVQMSEDIPMKEMVIIRLVDPKGRSPDECVVLGFMNDEEPIQFGNLVDAHNFLARKGFTQMPKKEEKWWMEKLKTLIVGAGRCVAIYYKPPA
jgi:hypothetical protein